MKSIIFALAMLGATAAFGQVGLSVGTTDSKIFVGVDQPNEARAHAGLIGAYDYDGTMHLGTKFGVYLGPDHLIAVNYKFFGPTVRGEMLTLSYEYNLTGNLFIGIEASADLQQLTIAYYIPSGKVGSGCY